MARSRTRTTREGEAPDFELPPPELVVIVDPQAGVRATPEGVEAADADADALSSALGATATMVPLFGLSEDRLRYEASAATERGQAPLPDLSIYYRVEAAEDRDLERLADRLAKHEAVVAAYVKPPAEPAQVINDMAPAAEDAPPVTPDFASRQGYLDAAPGGIDARYAWTQSGGRGAGVQIIDVEGAWRFSHEDLTQNQGGVIGGTQSTDINWRNHGTAVAGEFGGDANTLGITGICPEANVRAISIFGPGSGSAAAIRQAGSTLAPGDVILIELHRPGPRNNFQNRNDQLGYIAVEWWPDDFDAIRFAIGRGVIVVEAAGNGAENLDDALYNTPATGFPSGWGNPFNRATRDSGAIVVGAGAPPPGTHGADWGPDRSRLDFSNFGSVVDAQGWGREVTTSGYGDLQGGVNEDFWYTDRFSGTSSASPIVVGAIGCYQGVMRARGTPKNSAQVRSLLRSTGSPQQDAPGRPATQRIGNRPNLRRMLGGKLIVKELAKERKEIKVEKIEHKEQKPEKVELKEIKEGKELKLEKVEVKEGKLEVKEHKPEIEKLQVHEKIRDKLSDKLEEKFHDKLSDKLQDKLREGGGGGFASPPQSTDERLDRLEDAVSQLSHFIAGELRPELGEGALSQEPDIAALAEQLEKQAADAKQAKDAKDIEKLSEW
jgi:subtilase family protein